MRTPKSHFITLGPAIPIVSFKDFSRFRDIGVTDEQFRDMWTIVGPSVDRNMSAHRPLWEIFTAAYLEGLIHGSSLILDQQAKVKKRDIINVDKTATTN